MRGGVKFGVVVFPGSNCDQDCVHVLRDVLKQGVATLWHQQTSLKGAECVVLPGGFSYGDYLRTGAVARLSPIMRAVTSFAHDGGLVLGICNGFQILLEAGLLPGAMLRNTGLQFICKYVHVRVERTDSPFTNRFQQGQVLRLPIAHNEGNYTADAQTLQSLGQRRSRHRSTATGRGPGNRVLRMGGRDVAPRGGTQSPAAAGFAGGAPQVLFRYCDADGQLTPQSNPNGSMEHIAGICNATGNIMGMMPHPERSSEPELGSTDGRLLFESLLGALVPA